jgi:hypothetical protein
MFAFGFKCGGSEAGRIRRWWPQRACRVWRVSSLFGNGQLTYLKFELTEQNIRILNPVPQNGILSHISVTIQASFLELSKKVNWNLINDLALKHISIDRWKSALAREAVSETAARILKELDLWKEASAKKHVAADSWWLHNKSLLKY